MEEVKEVTEAKEVRDSEALCFGMATFFVLVRADSLAYATRIVEEARPSGLR
jgi:hypothetical protein